MNNEVFNTLNALDVNGHKESKAIEGKSFDYLSWTWAWAEVKKRYPDASYEVERSENGLPYVYDPNTGYMVFTNMTIEGITHEMWLPVMDGKNKAMKAVPYKYKTKWGEKDVEPATMTDINKTIMRCLVKNMAMFGLGLYIYAGEDLPEGDQPEDKKVDNKSDKKADKKAGYFCAKCGEEIKPVKANGQTVFVDDLVKRSQETYGNIYCVKCAKEIKANESN